MKPRLSARGRIVGWMVLLIVIAFGSALFIASQVISLRADSLVTDELVNETENFRQYAQTAPDEIKNDVDLVLQNYLAQKVPDAGESYFTMIDGEPNRRSSVEPPQRLDQDERFVSLISTVTKPSTGWYDSDAGKVRYAVLPVTVEGDDQQGALVILEFRDIQAKPLTDTLLIFAAVSLVALLLASAISWVIAGRVLEPVRLVRQTAEKITETDQSRRIPVTGKDDVARLAHTFNTMLDRLESTLESQKAFIDNTSHELRTPIAVVRGHIELLGDDPEERAATKAIILEELDRMKRIVDDIMVLARADRPGFLHIEDVNLADVTLDVLSTMQVTADRVWRLDDVTEETIRGDHQRLHQALIALVSNSIKFTEPGDRISIGSSYHEGITTLWVDDSGAGVKAEDADVIFERFQRGQGTKRIDGTGLGLAIVKTIAEAHGGNVKLQSRPGNGARFVITIPTEPANTSTVDPHPTTPLETL